MERITARQSYYSPLTPEWEVYRTVDNHSVTAPLRDLANTVPITSEIKRREIFFIFRCSIWKMKGLLRKSSGSFRECHANLLSSIEFVWVREWETERDWASKQVWQRLSDRLSKSECDRDWVTDWARLTKRHGSRAYRYQATCRGRGRRGYR